MKRSLAVLALFVFLATIHCCKKAEYNGDDVFRVTYLRPSDGCPDGPLVHFAESDVVRLERFVHSARGEGHQDGWVISAVNLENSYREGQTLVLKIRKIADDEIRVCPAYLISYTGVHVLSAHSD